MEECDAVPTPFFVKGETTIQKDEIEDNSEEKIDFSENIDKNYLFICSQKGKK